MEFEQAWGVAQLVPEPAMQPLVPDRGGYTLTMRECAGADETLVALAQEVSGIPGPGHRLHAGWGSFRNLDIAAARRSRWLLLLDVNAHQFRVWDAVARVLPAARDAADFVQRVVPELPHVPRLRQFADSAERWLRGDLERPGSWLFEGTPERFEHMRELFAAGRAATACMDLRGGRNAGTGPFAALAERLRAAGEQAGVEVDTLYVSNIPWMLSQATGFFGESHEPHTPEHAASVLQSVHENLAQIAPQFRWVVQAMHLRADATPENLQWLTQLQPPDAFLAQENWQSLR